MSPIPSSESRRKLLKSIALGGGALAAGKSLPDIWTKPVVDTVSLPVHAEMTCCNIAGLYCAGNGFGYIEISVSATGSVNIFWDTGQPKYETTGAIGCGGGVFDLDFNTGAAPASIVGTVNCGPQSITGTLFSGAENFPYVANSTICLD